MKELLKSVIAALDGVEVRGRENMDKLLGSIRALETIVVALEQAQTDTEDKENKEESDG